LNYRWCIPDLKYAVLIFKLIVIYVSKASARYVKIEDLPSWLPDNIGERVFYVLHGRTPLTRTDLEAYGIAAAFERYEPQYQICNEQRLGCRFVTPLLVKKQVEVELVKGLFSKKEVQKVKWVAELVNQVPEGLPKMECVQPPQGRRVCAVKVDGAERVYVDGAWLGIVVKAWGSLEEEMGRVVHILIQGGEWSVHDPQPGYVQYAYSIF